MSYPNTLEQAVAVGAADKAAASCSPVIGERDGVDWLARLTAVHPMVWVSLFILVCLVPFLDKAFFIDDTLFLRAAEQIQKHPLDFYGFNINWFGYTTTMTEAFDNPPLTSYYIALVASLVGWSEVALHSAFLLVALAAGLGIFKLASCYCERPLLAALVAILTPAFLVSATAVMCDVMLLAFWVWALYWFELGLKKDNRWGFACSGCLAGCAFITKYPGFDLVPLMVAYGFLRQRKVGFWLIGPVIPLVFAGGYEWLTHHLYGSGLLGSAGTSAASLRNGTPEIPWEGIILGLAFAGGCFAPLVLFGPLLWTRKTLSLALCCIPISLMLFPRMAAFSRFLWAPDGSLNWGLFLFILVLTAGGLQLFGLALANLWRSKDPTAIMLLLWIGGVFVFTVAINWTINARSLLPALPAVGILVERQLAFRFPKVTRKLVLSLSAAGIPAFALAMVVLKADYDLANVERSAATELVKQYADTSKPLWYRGDHGFQYYAERSGAKPLDLKSPQIAKGERLISLFETQEFMISGGLKAETLEVRSFRAHPFCTTMSNSEGAGFYASVRRPFPFVFGKIAPRNFGVFQVSSDSSTAAREKVGL